MCNSIQDSRSWPTSENKQAFSNFWHRFWDRRRHFYWSTWNDLVYRIKDPISDMLQKYSHAIVLRTFLHMSLSILSTFGSDSHKRTKRASLLASGAIIGSSIKAGGSISGSLVGGSLHPNYGHGDRGGCSWFGSSFLCEGICPNHHGYSEEKFSKCPSREMFGR